MSEESLPRLDSLHLPQGLLHRQVRGMRLMPQRVHNHDVQPSQQLQGRFREVVEVGQIGHRPETES